MKTTKQSSGFVLLEILAAIALVLVLAVLLVPNFSVYLKKGKFQDVVNAVNMYKPAVATCLQVKGVGNSASCDSFGENGIPANAFGTAKGNVAANGIAFSAPSTDSVKITGTGSTAVDSSTYAQTLTVDSSGIVSISASGACATDGLC